MARRAPERGRIAGEPPPEPRRFHLIGVGLGKSGTSTLASLFERFHWGHEFLFEEAVMHASARRRDAIGADAIREFLRERDRTSRLELDSTSFNHFFLDLLIEEFPDARFLLTLRDGPGFAESFLNMMLRNRRRYPETTLPEWQIALGRLMSDRFDPEDFVSAERLAKALPGLIDSYLGFWARENRRILGLLPPERSLVVRTCDLDRSRGRIAGFAGVGVDRLQPSHANEGRHEVTLRRCLPPGRLAEAVARNGADLMREWFPEIPVE